MQDELIKIATSKLEDKSVCRVIGWRKGEFGYDLTPSVFTDKDDLAKHFVYDEFAAPNLSKYLVKLSRAEGKTLVFLKPCDTYSFSQLLKEHRIKGENVYVVGIPCNGKIDNAKLLSDAGADILSAKSDGKNVIVKTLAGEKTLALASLLEERCLVCKSKKHMVYDQLVGEEGETLDSKRFDIVEKIEAMSSEDRYRFWRHELSRCIRCNACRDVCPACTCEHCVFDNENSGAYNKAPGISFEENMYHIIRAFHVAGRCTDCGECSRVCPEHIPLHLLNRKFIKDINSLYGEYQAGEEKLNPLTDYDKQDPDPRIVYERGGKDHV